ncbi:DUF4241 domain-containing protein [Pimelobacter simplex]|uniref:DUF4241 domain-containing protein n=1 Tax=Nocardioides simplex TaxID=2045 RepID=UPI003AAF3AF4
MAATPQARVEQFVTDYFARWEAVAPHFETAGGDGFAHWLPALAGLEERHLAPGTGFRIETSFARPAPFRPGGETVTAVTTDGDTSTVRVAVDDVFDSIREYVLRRTPDGWLIDHYATYDDDPDLPYVTAGEAAALVAACSPTAPLAPLGPEDDERDPGAPFRPGPARLDDLEGTVEVRPAGTLTTTSGVLTVVDLGYENDDARPLARTVPPGTYPVEVSTVFGRNAGLRLLLGPGEPVAWRRAEVAGGGHVLGVDAGNLCLADYPSYAVVVRRDKEHALDLLARETARPAVRGHAFGDDDRVTAIVADSGWGDGAYPAYWGLDADGTTVQLVVDFVVLP